MSTNEDRELRGFMQGMVRAEAAEVTPAGDVPDAAADQRLADAMVAKYGPRRPTRRRGWVGVTTGISAAAVLGIILVVKLRGDDPPLDYHAYLAHR